MVRPSVEGSLCPIVFGLEAYLTRIGLDGHLKPDMETLRSVVAAHCVAIIDENIDVLRGKPPQLGLDLLQNKMVRARRGGYCFEQNMLLRAVLRGLGFTVTGRVARVVRGFQADAPRIAAHMVLQVDMAEGTFLG